MSDDPKARLSHDEILAAGVDDWRKVLNRLKARFRTGDFATGVALVDRIGAAADEPPRHVEAASPVELPGARAHVLPRRGERVLLEAPPVGDDP